MMGEGEAGGTKADDEHLVAGGRPRQGPPDVERVPPGQQRIDLKTPGQAQHVLQGAGLDLRDVDGVLPLVDAGLHAVVADAVTGRGADRVVDRNDGKGAEAVAARLHQIHLGNLLLERAPREGHAKDGFFERAVLLFQTLRAAVLALVVTPNAVIRLVERADEAGAGIGQRKPLAAPPFVFGQAQHRHAVALDGIDRHEVMHVEPMRYLEQHPAAVLAPAFGRQCRPGGIALRRVERGFVGGFVLEPIRDMPGVAPFPGRSRFTSRRADQSIQLVRELGPVDRHGVGFLDPLDGAPLNKQALDRIKWRQRVLTRLQGAHLGFDAEQPADEIFEMGREIDQEV